MLEAPLDRKCSLSAADIDVAVPVALCSAFCANIVHSFHWYGLTYMFASASDVVTTESTHNAFQRLLHKLLQLLCTEWQTIMISIMKCQRPSSIDPDLDVPHKVVTSCGQLYTICTELLL